MKRTRIHFEKEETDLDRLKGIIRTLKECEQEVTQEAVAKQFKIETGRILKE